MLCSYGQLYNGFCRKNLSKGQWLCSTVTKNWEITGPSLATTSSSRYYPNILYHTLLYYLLYTIYYIRHTIYYILYYAIYYTTLCYLGILEALVENEPSRWPSDLDVVRQLRLRPPWKTCIHPTPSMQCYPKAPSI